MDDRQECDCSACAYAEPPDSVFDPELCGGDLREAGAIEALEQREAEEFAVEVELAEETAE